MARSLSYWTRGAAVATAVLAAPAIASATPTGSAALVTLLGASAAPAPQDLTTANSVGVSLPVYISGPGQGDLSGISGQAAFSASTWNVTSTGLLDPITPFTVIVGTDTCTFGEQEVTTNSHIGTGAAESSVLSITFIGNVTGRVTPNPDTASATFTWNQTGGSGAALSWEGTLAHPSQFVPAPEPGSVAILGASLAMFGLIRRRRA
jgi:hypothetical protein